MSTSDLLLFASLGLIVTAILMTVVAKLKLRGALKRRNLFPEYEYAISFVEGGKKLKKFYFKTKEKFHEEFFLSDGQWYVIHVWYIGRGDQRRFETRVYKARGNSQKSTDKSRIPNTHTVVRDESNRVIHRG